MPWLGRGMAVYVVLEKTCSLGEPIFLVMGQVNTQEMCARIHSFLIHSPHPAKDSRGCSLHAFLFVPSSFHG